MPELTRRRSSMLPTNAGTSITVMSASARSRSAPACLWRRSLGLELRLLSWRPSERMHSGTAATFDRARADFEQAWQVFLSKRTAAGDRQKAP
jgi:hypothetical protein